MQTVIRYINNTDTDVVVGDLVVPKYDQIIVNEFVPALDAMTGKSLTVLVDGVLLSPDLVPANIAVEAEALAAAEAEAMATAETDTAIKPAVKPK